MRKISRKWFAILLTLAIFITSAPVSVAAPELSGVGGTAYYISSSEGDNGNDGLSADKPWKDFTNVNSKVFAPGDEILLKRGDVWNQLLQPAGGNGTPDAPIVISGYGDGPRPVIEGAGTYSNTLVINNGSYWTLRGLEFRKAKMGPQFLYTTLKNQGIVIEDNYIHSLVGGPDAIALHVRCDAYDLIPEDTDDAWIAKDVLIQNNIIGPTSSYGIVVMNSNTEAKANAFQNVMVKNNRLESVSAKAIVFQCVKNSYWLGNYVNDAANAAQQGGTTASFLFRTENMHISNNVFINTPDTQSSDQSAVDSEGQNESTHYTGNYFGNNFGGAIEFLMINGEIPPRYGEDYNRGHVISGNTFSANNTGALWATTDTGTTSGSVTDNLYYENNLLRDPAKFTEWNPISGNTSIPGAEKIYNAAMDFAGTAVRGWSYEKQNGGYTTFAFDEAKQIWGTEDAYISQFVMEAGGGTVSRSWTVPYDGTISLGGQAATGATGTKATVRVTKNGQTVEGTEKELSSMEGVPMNYSNITVSKGDVLRFEVIGSGEVFWIPSIAYTAGGNDAGDVALTPAAVTDLTVTEKNHNKAVLQWTAPGRDGNTGTASKYELRYSKDPITEGNFDQATAVTTVPFPAKGGQMQQTEVTMLEGATTYYFAIRTYNEIPNISPLSNVATCETDADVTELQNPGFEDGMNAWTVQGASAEIRYGDSHSGANAVYVSDRVDSWGSVVQDVTGILNANGPGTYNFGAWARFENTSSKAFLTIAYEDQQGSYWVTTHNDDGTGQGVTISTTEYTQINATRNITWTGSLKKATIYFQSIGNTTPVYLDDFFLAPSEDQVDRGSLSTAINRAAGITKDGYTEESYGNLTALLADANTVMVREDATQDEVDMVCNLLNAAISSLEKPTWQQGVNLSNPGFEEGIEPWKDNGGAGAVLSLRTDKVHSGNQALYITNRGDSWHGTVQTVTDVLNAAGPGLYQFGTWAMYESQSSRAVVTLAWNDGTGHYATSHEYENGGQGVVVSKEEFTEICGVREIAWEGTLTDATIYFQSMQGGGNTDNLTLDDFFLIKIRKTPLLTLYNRNKDKEQGTALEENYQTFCQALEQAAQVLGDSRSTQAVIDGAREELMRAVEGLSATETDKQNLEQRILEAEALKADDYIASGYADVLAKLKVAKAVQADRYASQKGVNLAEEILANTISMLEQRPDKTTLQTLYDASKDNEQNGVDALRWEAFRMTLENAKGVLEDEEARKPQVDAAVNALQHAADALIKIPALELQNPGFEEGNADASDTSWKWPDWKTIVTDPALVHSGNQALHVTGRWAEYIGPEQDITALLNAGGPGMYEFGCWARFENSDSTAQVVITLNGAENILSKATDTTTTQYAQVSDRQNLTWEGQLTSAVLSFRSGNTNNGVYLDDFFLKKVEGPDRTRLNALLEMYAYVTADGWTQETYDGYKAARDAAEALGQDVDQDAVNAAAAQLETAAKALVRTAKQPVDNGALLAAFQSAEALNADDYTPETFAVVTAKKAVADALLQDTYGVPDMIALVLAELQDAVAHLAEADDTDAGNSGGDSGDTGNSGGDTGNPGGDSGDTGNPGGDTGNPGGDTGNPGGDSGDTGNPGGDSGDTGNPGGDSGNTGNPGGDAGDSGSNGAVGEDSGNAGNDNKQDGAGDKMVQNPKTGEDNMSQVILWMMLLISTACASAIIRKKKEKLL